MRMYGKYGMTARAENLDVACLMDALLTCGCDGVREKLHISEDIKNICNIPKDLNAAFKSKPKFKTATSQAVDSGMKMLLLRFFLQLHILCFRLSRRREKQHAIF